MVLRVLHDLRDDFEGIAQLAETVYGPGTPLAERAYLEWKYFKNPFGALALVYEDSHQIVGFTGYTVVPMKVDGLTLRSAIGADSMVLPRYRRHGVFASILRYADEQKEFRVDLVYGTQNPESPTIRALKKYLPGQILVGDIIVLKKYLLPIAALRCLWIYPKLTATNFAKYVGTIAEWAYLVTYSSCVALRAVFRRANRDSGARRIEVKEISPLVFGDEFDRLWERSREPFRVAVARTKQYLNWRFANPQAFHVGLRLDEGGNLRGYCILSYTKEREQKTGWIIDLLAETPRLAVILVQEAMRRAKRNRAHVVMMWGNGTWQGLPRRLGLGKSWWKLALALRSTSSEVPFDITSDISNWYLTVGDTDDRM
jgi:GNAT superfamily N-acetyltransferase